MLTPLCLTASLVSSISVWTIVNLAPTCSNFDCYLTISPTETVKERGIMSPWLQNIKLENYAGEQRFQTTEGHCLLHLAIFPIPFDHCFGRSRGPQSCTATASTRANLLVNAFVLFPHNLPLAPPTPPHILPILRTQRCSNTKIIHIYSALNAHVSEP